MISKRLRVSEPTAARPGPGLLPEALLRTLDVNLARRVEGLLAGDYRSQLIGRGTELAQLRPYDPETDDVRHIDWKATARTGIPHVRVHLAERILVSWMVVDTTPSMEFGTADRRKADVAEGVALALGYAATRRGNKLGTVVFGEDGVSAQAPRQGRPGMMGLINGLRGVVPSGAGSSLEAALRYTGKLARQRALVVVISDFRGDRDWRRALLEVAGRHEVICVEVRDPREQELPDAGELRLVDPETGRQLRVNTSSAVLRRRFAAAAEEERKTLASMLAGAGVRHAVVSTEGDWLRSLTGFLRARPARR